MNQQIEDSIVKAVMTKFYERSQTGIKKYNTTLDRNDLSTLEWLNHIQEELMDATLYVERLKHEFKTKQEDQCKCSQPKVGGYSCQRTDCNQNL